MYICRRAKVTDVENIIKLMQNTKYSDFVYPDKSSYKLKKIILESMKHKEYLVCSDPSHDKLAGYFIIDSIKNHLTDIPKNIRLKSTYAYHAGVGVHSDYRGKGLATKLTKYAFKTAKKMGYSGIYADVCSNNEASIRLQLKCGFKETIRYDSNSRPENTKNVVFEIKF